MRKNKIKNKKNKYLPLPTSKIEVMTHCPK